MFNSDIPAPETQVSDLFWDCSGFRQFFVVRHCKIINDFIDNKLQLRRQLSDQSGKIILVRWDESIELQTNLREYLTIVEKAPTRAVSFENTY